MDTHIYRVSDAIAALDEEFPLGTQDGWDNSGLLVGDANAPLSGILLTVDITGEVVDEAIATGCNLVVSHHPIMFSGLKRLTGSTAEQRTIIKALKHDVALAAFHTPADKQMSGTSGTIGRMLGLRKMSVLEPEEGALVKVVVYVPEAQAEAVRTAMAEAGAGHIGNYSHCSWQTSGTGRFKALDGATPYVGEMGKIHLEPEARVEVICPKRLTAKVVAAATASHPYEEPAIDVVPIANSDTSVGYGVVGDLDEATTPEEFLALVKNRLECDSIRYNGSPREVRRVAICTGSGSEFIGAARRSGADAYVTADVKYHQLAEAPADMLVLDIGHYESEKVTKSIFRDVLTRKLANFARYEISRVANPIKYF